MTYHMIKLIILQPLPETLLILVLYLPTLNHLVERDRSAPSRMIVRGKEKVARWGSELSSIGSDIALAPAKELTRTCSTQFLDVYAPGKAIVCG